MLEEIKQGSIGPMCQGLILRVRNATLPLCISCTRLANGADPADLIEPAANTVAYLLHERAWARFTRTAPARLAPAQTGA